MAKSVDVIVPCYNYGSYLIGCVRSLLDQEGVAVRVLVLDDHSSDNTQEVGLALARSDERVTFRRHAANQGHIATYNEGFAWAAADYVLLISADDLLTPGALKRAVTALEANPQAAFACGRQVSFGDRPYLPAEPNALAGGYEVIPGRTFMERLCVAGDNPVATPTVVVRTTLQHRAGNYEPTLPHTADLEMWLRLATLGDVIRLDAYQAFKRKHRTNMQHAYVMNPTRDLVERHRAFQMFVDAMKPAASGALRSAAASALSMSAFWRAAELFDAGRTQEASQLLALALEMDPGIRRRSEWRLMMIKTQLGTTVWRLLRPLVQRVRRDRQPIAAGLPS